jgi:hypothetical protein
MDIKTLIALLAIFVTVAGWLINHVLQSQREYKTKKREALLRYTERQLEELYGPLALLLIEGRRTFKDLLEIFGRKYIFVDDQPLSKEEFKTWIFWAENDFMPRNDKIKTLLMSKTHLIEGDEIPESYITFLDHCNSWQINHLRWKEEKVEYTWRSKIDWPKEFSKDVLATFKKLRKRHASLIFELKEKHQ